jgi:hypothetical protein
MGRGPARGLKCIRRMDWKSWRAVSRQVAQAALVLWPLSRGSQNAECGEPSEYLSRWRRAVRRRANAARSLCAVLGQGQALDNFAGGNGAHFENRRSWRGARAERCDCGRAFRIKRRDGRLCQVNFVERDALMRLMEKNGEFGLHASQALAAAITRSNPLS